MVQNKRSDDGRAQSLVPHKHYSKSGIIAGVLGEILLTLAVLCAFYIIWQLWWTGVVAEQEQNKQFTSTSWVTPGKTESGSYKIAQPQSGNPPILPQPSHAGEVLGELYIPRFSHEYKRLIVQGTTLEQLNRHGVGHYTQTPMFGAIGNVGIAGHREGYGSPLGDVAELQKGDEIIIRTNEYWYVYSYQNKQIVLPSDTEVILPVPNEPGAKPTERLLTLTTCTPRYGIPTHRWVAYATFKYWAYVKDGIPAALATQNSNGTVSFPENTNAWSEYIPPLSTLIWWILAAYIVIFLAAALVWRWPSFDRRHVNALGQTSISHVKTKRRKKKKQSEQGLYSALLKIQPGVEMIRWVLLILLLIIAILAMFNWGYPWLAENIPYLRHASNYVAVQN